MTQLDINLAVIVGSVRGGRLGPTVAKWVAGEARRFGQFEVHVIDLAEFDLPLAMPSAGESPPPDVIEQLAPLSAKLASADAFVVVTPEYNHSFPASLKNAIDWHDKQWYGKPIGLVSYGGISGGLRAIEHLRTVFAELHAVTIRDTVSFHYAGRQWDSERNWPKDTEACTAAGKTMLNHLSWWALSLREAKAKRPFPA